MEWLKAFYETFGTPYPRMSLVSVMLLGAIFSGALWLVLARQVEKGRQLPNPPSQVSGPASTTGSNSPANTGNGNDIRYDQSSNNHEKKRSPKKE
jgi:hypothetical protein